ncbi:protein-export chaperone SecB [Clostridium tertium]|uniref:protein-export chaperone SecB n=1 Tax=Clostridium tertium TaxID=1559 RepID=UPI002A833C72|nr:protein-export chaperone SecB [Clostridium tertium]MDY4604005.1 protein-export chaperone SecB [Clostridium tertium]
MNGQEGKCSLILNDVYVKSIDFRRNRDFSDDEINLDFKIGSKIEKSEDDRSCEANIHVVIKDNNEKIHIDVEYVGVFGIDNLAGLNKGQQEYIMKKSTLAILFPFVRSFITTITSQTGIKPIILPPININALMEKSNKDD